MAIERSEHSTYSSEKHIQSISVGKEDRQQKNRVITQLRELGKNCTYQCTENKIIYRQSSPALKQMIKFEALELLIPLLV